MKKISLITFLTLFLLSGTVMAADLNGTWVADNWCVPGDDSIINPWVPKYEESGMEVTQQDQFFTTLGTYPISGEVCGGVIQGKKVYLTCPGTIFQGELKGPNKIIGINHNPDDGATCYIEARRQ